MVKTNVKRILNESEITRKEDALIKKHRSPIAGAGIMLLNSQIKKRLPQISIDERSKLAVEVWSKMNNDEHKDLRSEGFKGWICDPRRKEIASGPEPLDTYTKNTLHRTTFQKSISLVELPPKGKFMRGLLNLQTDSNRISDNPPLSHSSRENLQTIARAFAEEVSMLSADIPQIYQVKSMATIDSKERIAAVVKKMQKRSERLRAYAAIPIKNSRTTGEVIDDCINQIGSS